MDDEGRWKQRFHLFLLARVFGLAIFAAGLAIAFTDWLRPGGWPAMGGALVVLGVIDAVLVPNMLRKHWRREDEGR